MAWFGGRRAEVAELRTQLDKLQSRAIGGFPWIENNPAVPFGSGGPAHPSQVQVGVDHALRLAPVYAAARLLADGVASLPLQVYAPDTDGIPKKWTGPSIFNSTTETGPLGQGPSIAGTVYDWLFTAMTSLVLEGNSFGYIAARDGFQFPTVIEWLAPSDVWIDENETSGIYNPGRAEYYFKGRHIPKTDMLHIRAFSVAGRTRGISPLRAFASLVSQGEGINAYGRDWFANGGFPPGVMRNTMMEVDDESSAAIKARLVAAIRRRQPLVIGADWEYTPVRVPPNEAQFIESVAMNATQIAAIYGVPPYRIGGTRGDSLTYSNVESEAISFYTDTLRPWLVRLECAFYGILPGRRYCRFNADAMIKTDTKTRHEVYQIDRTIGLRSIDELRRIEDEGPLPSKAGEDEMPLLVSSDLARSGKAIPKVFADNIQVLDIPAGVTPGLSGDVTKPTPDPSAAGGNGAGPPKASGNGSAPKAADPAGKPAAPKRPRGAAKPPPARGDVVASITDVAQAWAGAAASDPGRLRVCLAETGMQARRHEIAFTSYIAPCMTETQRDWLIGFMRGHGAPSEDVRAPASGDTASRA